MAAIEKKPEILEAHADNIERADSAGVQLLAAVKNQCEQQNIIWKLPKASEVFTDTVNKLGLSKHF